MSLRRRIALYGLVFFSALVLASSLLWLVTQPRRFAPSPDSRLPGKTAFYLAQAGNYDLLFLGDSRTYCAFHPEILDPLLGTRSFNLAHWANWLPTQFPHVQAVAGGIPRGTTVVWSVGENNFSRLTIHDTYPIGFANVPRYLALGIALPEMADNLIAFNPATYLYAKRGALLEHMLALAARPLGQTVTAASAHSSQAYATQAPSARQGVLRSEVQSPEGRPVAESLFMAGGGYLLEEIDPAHFRAKQMRITSAAPPQDYVPDPSRWATFRAMLDLFREHRTRLVVNVMEEAPHMYGPGARERIRAFMDGPVRREVEARGFVFLRADMDQLTSADYFDYNHLNSRGVEKYSRLFAAALAPHLKQLRGQ